MRIREFATAGASCAMVIAGLLLVVCLNAGGAHYLFTSFRGNGEDGLHLALSTNGYHWSAVRGDKSFFRPEIGGKLMRDPCIARGPDGVFHMVWTTSWTAQSGKVIGYARTRDLVNWSQQKGIPLMQNEPGTRNLWAPELFYDSARNRWLILWSSTVTNRFQETNGTGDDGYNHRIYYTTTRDFEEFAESRLLYDPGFNIIDATIFERKGKFYMVLKDERKTPLKKNLRLSVADRPEGPYGPPGEPFTISWVEGPSVLAIGDEIYVYFDHYSRPHYYGAVRSKDLVTWVDVSKDMVFPRDHRHGTVISIPEDIASALMKLNQ